MNQNSAADAVIINQVADSRHGFRRIAFVLLNLNLYCMECKN